MRFLILCLLFLVLPAALAADPCESRGNLRADTLQVFGIPAMPSSIRAFSVSPPLGDLFLANANGKGKPKRLTESGDYFSPIFEPDGHTVLALWRRQLVRLPTRVKGIKEPALRLDVGDAIRLAGFVNGSKDAVAYIEDQGGEVRPMVFCLKNHVRSEPEGDKADYELLLSRLRSNERIYKEGTDLEVRIQEDEGNVFLQRQGSAPLNISRCDAGHCTQGALSADGKHVIFVWANPPS